MAEKTKKGRNERLKTYSDRTARQASFLSEKEYQHFIMRYLEKHNGYLMSGNQISVITLDLNQEFQIIAEQLNQIVKDHFNINV